MEINWLAVIVATISSFVLGFIWYNPKFLGKAWQKAAGISDESMKDSSGMGRIFGTAFVLTFIMALILSYFLKDVDDLMVGMRIGVYLGLGISTMSIGVNAMYERKGFGYILINGGYQTISMVIMAAIITAWS